MVTFKYKNNVTKTKRKEGSRTRLFGENMCNNRRINSNITSTVSVNKNRITELKAEIVSIFTLIG